MSADERLTLSEIETLARTALEAAGTAPHAAIPLAAATAETEAMGVASHGLAYVPTYALHVRCGKVDGTAVPDVSMRAPAVLEVDARNGFAHPAIASGFEQLVPLAREMGVATLVIRESYNCGVLGVHTAALAREGLLGLGFTNAPASIAPSGGKRPVVGTNPISMAAPDGSGGVALLVDQSASVIAKSEIMKHAREGKPIPEGWGLGPDGLPTTDADVALKGTMAPAGDYKGVGLALIVETFAAALAGASLGINASPFSGEAGGPPRTGQAFIAVAPGEAFGERIVELAEAVRSAEGRLPGDGRAAARRRALEEGVLVSGQTLQKVRALLA